MKKNMKQGELATPLTEKKATFKDRASLIKKEYGYIALAMFIPAVLFFLIYLARGLYPFGDGTVLVLDLNGQYVYFFEALKNTVLAESALLRLQAYRSFCVPVQLKYQTVWI